MNPTALEWVMGAWFVTAIPIVVFGNLWFFVFLKRQGANVRFAWVGTPGYLDRVYRSWCLARGLAPTLIRLRRVALLNALCASMAFAFVFSHFSQKRTQPKGAIEKADRPEM